jgi:hypothetical protein
MCGALKFISGLIDVATWLCTFYNIEHIVLNGKKLKLSLSLTNCALRDEDVWGSECIGPRILDLSTS